MHVNRNHPNILQDKQAVANGAILRNPLSKRSRIPRKDYRHCADAQIIGVDLGERSDPVNPAQA